MRIKKGDTVLITTGKDKGKKGKISKAFPKESRVMVENVNLIKKHMKPRKAGEKGQIIQIASSIDLSNVKLVCPKCGKPARTGYRIVENKKYRICKKCGQEI